MGNFLKVSQRFTKDGVPLVGASVLVTVSGGNVPARLYSSSSGISKYPSNVLTTGANGQVSAYVDGSNTYRMVVTAAGGSAPISTIDPVLPLESGVESRTDDAASLAVTTGSLNATTGLSVDVQRTPGSNIATLVFTLNAVSLVVTDAAGSGASASLKLFDFVQAGIVPLGCRQNYTAFAEGAALTGDAGDAVFVMGLGSVAANAGDGVLTGTEVDFADVTGTITLSGGTGTGTLFSGTKAALDGTATAKALYLNWSGTAATIDATSTISVTGTVQLSVLLLGDD